MQEVKADEIARQCKPFFLESKRKRKKTSSDQILYVRSHAFHTFTSNDLKQADFWDDERKKKTILKTIDFLERLFHCVCVCVWVTGPEAHLKDSECC